MSRGTAADLIRHVLGEDWKWTTRQGEKIAPSDMDQEHLVATIRMMVRKDVHVRNMIMTLALLDELQNRAEEADSAEADRIYSEVISSELMWGSD